ncbi:MAG: TadE family protein [Dehalococcoidia bacterium]
MVEFALVAPIVLFVLFAAVQFALIAHAQNVVTTAAQEGARFAAAEGRSPADGSTRAEDVLRSGLGGGADGFIVTAQGSDETVMVRTEGQYRLIIPWLTGRDMPIEATAEVRREGFRRGP